MYVRHRATGLAKRLPCPGGRSNLKQGVTEQMAKTMISGECPVNAVLLGSFICSDPLVPRDMTILVVGRAIGFVAHLDPDDTQ